ncbi:MAG: hypothetical protein K1Y36_11500 [Blastocatellia bacterium]|nr:hypothetical protein [Blastocatellia bacterium]
MKYVNVKDGDLRVALREQIGNDLNDETLKQVKTLDWSEYRAEAGAYWRAVYDLSGIEYCVNLKELLFDGNGVKNLRPLAGLTQLEEIWLVQNQVTDLKPLAGLTKLRVLVLDLNARLKNLAPLAGLPALEYLNVAGTAVVDLAPLLELPALNRLAWNPPRGMTKAALNRVHGVLTALHSRGVKLERYQVPQP